MAKRIDLVGRRFNKRVVLRFDGVGSNSRSRWQVVCDCGNKFICYSQDLKRGGFCQNCRTDLSNPRPHKRKRPFEYQYNTWVHRARHDVFITYDQFVGITSIRECHYCNSEVQWMEHFLKGSTRTSASNLDRKDCSLPYTLDNVVVCCWRCNKAKNTLFTYEEWKKIGEVIKTL